MATNKMRDPVSEGLAGVVVVAKFDPELIINAMQVAEHVRHIVATCELPLTEETLKDVLENIEVELRKFMPN